MGQMERALKDFGQNTQQLSDTASNVRENIQFMNQLNSLLNLLSFLQNLFSTVLGKYAFPVIFLQLPFFCKRGSFLQKYRALARNVMERQWLLRPEELETEHKVGELYQIRRNFFLAHLNRNVRGTQMIQIQM